MRGKGFLAIALLTAILCGWLGIGAADDEGNAATPINADSLWDLVSTCVNREGVATAAPLCTCKAFALSCCGDRSTPNDAVVWAETPEFVAIRNLKMCGCDAGFVAGLALPRTRVSGLEDPHRPEGIWPFAWEVAHKRIRDELDIALMINPIPARSQNQLHVHLLRLKPGVRAKLEAALQANGTLAEPPGTIVFQLANVNAVFADAIAHVGAARLGDHGILVARAREGGFLAAITHWRSPDVLTVSHCRK